MIIFTERGLLTSEILFRLLETLGGQNEHVTIFQKRLNK